VTDVVAPPAKRSRPALWIAIGLAVVLALLIAVLATRDNAATRLVRSPLVSHPVPALTGTTVDGSRSYDIDDHQGEWVLVNFFATWCVPCQQEHDDLARFQKFHAAAGDASVVSVVFADQTSDVRRFFAQRGGDWPVVRDEDGALATAFGVARVPESYLVAPDGTVAAKVTGGVTFDFLQEQLGRLEAGG
jgi:cytochrome c biogenesis protein CcmG/thiol:disulfide interchange protein DsbE